MTTTRDDAKLPRREFELYAAVLAGGLSSRMGRDKRFLEIDGESLVDRAIRLASGAIYDEGARVLLCGEVPGYPCFPDQTAGLGPIEGLASGMRQMEDAASERVSWLLVMPVDMPLLTPRLLDGLVSKISETESDVSGIGYQEYELPFVLRCDGRARAALKKVCAESDSSFRSIRAFLGRLGMRRVPLPDSAHKEMLNANSPSDWVKMNQEDSA